MSLRGLAGPFGSSASTALVGVAALGMPFVGGIAAARLLGRGAVTGGVVVGLAAGLALMIWRTRQVVAAA